MSHSGEVDSRGTQNTSPLKGDLGVKPAQEKNPTKNGNPSATLGAILPAQEKNPVENGNPVRTGATLGTRSGNGELSPAGGGVTPVTGVERSRREHNTSPLTGDLGVNPISPQSPLYPSYLHILEKRKLSEEDLLHASWYSQHKRAEAAAPPPHLLTDEEIAKMERTLAEERRRTLSQPQYSTFGKMYFPEKDARCLL